MIAVVALALVGLAAVPPEDRERARALFEEAARAKSEARWADVRRLLQQSIEAYPQFSTAWAPPTRSSMIFPRPRPC